MTTVAATATTTVPLYRDIHKGIRAELFAVTESAGTLDAGDRDACAALATHVESVIWLLTNHAHHEDSWVGPVLVDHHPELAATIDGDHHVLDARIAACGELAATVGDRAGAEELYLELAGFTSAYLAHQDFEERIVQPVLLEAIGIEAAWALHGSIVAGIAPDVMARCLAVMLPAMNVDDRTELLGGVRAGAPEPVFQGVWSLAQSVLAAPDAAAVATRLGL
jgi:hypothetical protein